MGGTGSGRKQLAACGTLAKYKAHRKKGEDCGLCKEAMRLYGRERYVPKPKKPPKLTRLQRNKETVRNEKLKRGSCVDCGLVIDQRTIVCIDFDHRDPQQKSFTISYEMGRLDCSMLIEEMNKCDAVCRNCHALRTHKEMHYLVRRDSHPGSPSLFD
jgi:hypothetical protein